MLLTEFLPRSSLPSHRRRNNQGPTCLRPRFCYRLRSWCRWERKCCAAFGIGSLAQVKGIDVLQPVVLAVLAVLLVLWVLPEAREEERRGRWIAVARKWLNIDFDLVEVVRRTIGMARGG
jgi:hypothetical protein